MAHTKGRLGKIAVSTDGVSYTDVGGVNSLSSSDDAEEIDATDFDSAGFKEGEYGETQISLSVTVLRDEADAGQDIVRTAKNAKNLLYCRYRPYENAGSDQKIFQATVVTLGESNERNALVEETYEFRSSGTVTYSTQ